MCMNHLHQIAFTITQMVNAKYITIRNVIAITVYMYFCKAFEEDMAIGNSRQISTASTEFQYHDYEEPDGKWLENALNDIAYYLRNHKFNEWDRRYYKTKPLEDYVTFYKAFPIPSLKSIHWEVHKNCNEDFYKCITYLHSIVETAPFTRSDDITTSINKYSITFDIGSLQEQNNECLRALSYSEKTGLPFSGPKEKFIWRTSASYYMCWYTMKGIPALSMLGETCDNFANCLDNTFGNRNHDPRADDNLPFACAMYSFCPDLCCPVKYIKTLSECHNSEFNPCYIENSNNKKITPRRCIFDRHYNQNLDQIIENRWNVSCHCPQKGFKWDSQFGMCVDLNECLTEEHNCDKSTEDCLNLPGTYQCVCKWGHEYDKIKNKCIENSVLVDTDSGRNDKPFNVFKIFTTMLGYIF